MEPLPREVDDTLCGLAFAAASANVIMQLSRLPVGHGVARSTVDSGRVDKHPIKRLRTTSAYLAVAIAGTDEDRAAMRRDVNRVHQDVRSEPGDPVEYNAFDPELQLWVAACLFRGTEDVYTLLHGPPSPATRDVLYRHGQRLGTTLQVTDDMWPADCDAFDAYWERSLALIEMDTLTREYLQGIANVRFLTEAFGPAAAPLVWTLGPVNRLLTLGFLPEPFRDELGLPWTARHHRTFDRVSRAAAAVTLAMPRPLRSFPFNVYLWDTRRRIRTGRPIV